LIIRSKKKRGLLISARLVSATASFGPSSHAPGSDSDSPSTTSGSRTPEEIVGAINGDEETADMVRAPMNLSSAVAELPSDEIAALMEQVHFKALPDKLPFSRTSFGVSLIVFVTVVVFSAISLNIYSAVKSD
jgi:hypothetical protein